MIDAVVTRVKGLLLRPVETFRQSRDEYPVTVFTYFATLLLVHAILVTIIDVLGIEMQPRFGGMPGGIAITIMVFFMALAAGFILTLLFAAWLHLWVYLLGGRKGIMQTIKAVIYGHTPRLLLGWIPVIGFIFMLWSLVLGILGIRELQEISTGRAILAVAIAVMIPLILFIIVAAWFFTSYMTTGGMPAAPNNLFYD